MMDLADGDGEIDFWEFATLMAHKMGDANPDATLSAAFNVFDEDGDGTISSEELLNVMRNMGESATEEDLQRVINMIDINGDGSVDYDEFARAVTKEMQESGFTLVDWYFTLRVPCGGRAILLRYAFQTRATYTHASTDSRIHHTLRSLKTLLSHKIDAQNVEVGLVLALCRRRSTLLMAPRHLRVGRKQRSIRTQHRPPKARPWRLLLQPPRTRPCILHPTAGILPDRHRVRRWRARYGTDRKTLIHDRAIRGPRQIIARRHAHIIRAGGAHIINAFYRDAVAALLRHKLCSGRKDRVLRSYGASLVVAV